MSEFVLLDLIMTIVGTARVLDTQKWPPGRAQPGILTIVGTARVLDESLAFGPRNVDNCRDSTRFGCPTETCVQNVPNIRKSEPKTHPVRAFVQNHVCKMFQFSENPNRKPIL